MQKSWNQGREISTQWHHQESARRYTNRLGFTDSNCTKTRWQQLYMDLHVANTVIKQTRYSIPAIEAVSIELNGACRFSKLNLLQAYNQLELSLTSQNITFCTHRGLYHYKQLNYGTNAEAELFQHSLQETLQVIQGVKNIAGDIIMFGTTRDDHDQRLDECLSQSQ